MNQGDYGNVTGRKRLRDQLQCKSFKWYLDNIFPELFIPGDAVASGEVFKLIKFHWLPGRRPFRGASKTNGLQIRFPSFFLFCFLSFHLSNVEVLVLRLTIF